MINPRRGMTRTRIAVVLSILLIVGTSLMLVQIRRSDGQSSSAITEAWVDQKLVQWQPSSISPVKFGAVFTRASYDNILTSYNTAQVESADLGMIVSTNASYVRMDIGYDAWLKSDTAAQQEIASLVSQIKTDGKSLIIADAAAESYRHGGQIPWTQFQDAWVQRVKTLAALFHPDYYIVIKEPGWYAPMISDVLTNPSVQDPNSWLNLTTVLANTVHSVSPNTQVGVAIAGDSLSSNPSLYVPYLRGLSGISGVGFMGFDLYTTSGFDNTQNFLTQYGNQGKDVWIAECWSGDASVAFDSSRSTLDSNWIKVVYYFAEMEGAKMVIPFFTDLFASYSLTPTSPTDSSQIVSLYSQRTPVFYAYGNVIASNSGTSTQTTTSSASTSHTSGASTTQASSTSQEKTSTVGGGGGGRLDLLPIAAGVIIVLIVVSLAVVMTRGRRR